MKSILKLFLFLILFSCSNEHEIVSNSHQLIPVTNSIDSNIVEIISPYKISLEKEMNKVISYSSNDLTKGQPESKLGNFVCDLSLKYADGKANICVFNNGGLRDVILKGNITVKDIYQVMPFENELVIIELNNKEYYTLLEYLIRRGGEPVGGVIITKKKDTIISNYNDYKKVKILTSDYLANGGDNMDFFIGKEQKKLGVKLRDVIIEHCIETDTIKVNLDNRLIIEHE